MSNDCPLGDLKTKVGEEIRKLVGYNNTEYQLIINYTYWGNRYKKGFLEYCAKNNISLDGDPAQIAKVAREYRYTQKTSVYKDCTENKNTTVAIYGYTSIDARENGIQRCRNIILVKLSELIKTNKEPVGDPKAYYLKYCYQVYERDIQALIPKVSNKAKEELAEIKKIKNVLDRYQAKLEWFDKYVPANVKATSQYINRLATYKEIISDYYNCLAKTGATELFDEMMYSSTVQMVKKQCDKYDGKDTQTSKDEEESAKSQDANAQVNGTAKKEEGIIDSSDEGDTMITVANNHIGAYTNFMSHIGVRLVTYFNCLPVLNTTNTRKSEDNPDKIEYDLATDEYLGLPICMDATTCSSALYGISYKFTSVPAMIDAIEELANNNKNYACFKKFADDLRADYDFAYETFTVFAKTVIKKVQVVYNDGRIEVFNSNSRSSKLSAMFFNTRTALQNAILNVDAATVEKQLQHTLSSIDELQAYINNPALTANDEETDEETIEDKKNNIRKELVELFKLYYSNIEEGAILTYLDCANKANGTLSGFKANAMNLHRMLNTTNKESKDSKEIWGALKRKHRNIQDTNEKLEEEMQHGNFVDLSNREKLSDVGNDWLTAKQFAELNDVVRELMPYSTISLQLNSPNVEGNNSSDVINDSYLTNLVKLIQSIEVTTNEYGKKVRRSPALEAWAKKKIKSKSIKYNSLFLVQRDKETKEKLSEGLFDVVGDDIVITTNAEFLCQAALFDGSSYVDAGKNMTYDKMGKNDFLPTAYVAYHKTKQEREYNKLKGTSDGLATYFLRTPSDAPKTFCLTSARYDVSKLLVDADANEENTIVNKIISDFREDAKIYVGSEWESTYEKKLSPVTVSSIKTFEDEIIPIIMGRKELNLLSKDGLLNKVTEIGQNKEFALAFELPTEKEEDVKFTNSLETKKEREEDKKERKNKKYPKIIVKGSIYKKGDLPCFRANKVLGVAVKKSNEFVEKYINEDLKRIENVIRTQAIKVIHDENYRLWGRTYNMVTKTVDTNSPLFILIKNHFKKELLDAAVAVDHYFEINPTTGRVKNNKNKISTKTEELNEQGYLRYHLNKDGKVLTETEDGYLLEGNVFHSNKFTLSIETTNDKGEKVITRKNYLDPLITTDRKDKDKGHINLLYGGASGNYLHIDYEEDPQTHERYVADITLTREQNEAVDAALTQYILDYINQTDSKVKEYKDFIHGINPDWMHNADFAINYLLTMFNYDDLFEGNTKHYVSSQDFLKRAKEYQGSGIPYAAIDYADVFNDYDTITPIHDAVLNEGEHNNRKIQDILDEGFKKIYADRPELYHKVELRRAFNAVTVKNTKQTNFNRLNALRDYMINIFTNRKGFDKMDRTLAEKKAMDMLYGPIVYKVDKNGNFVKDKNGHLVPDRDKNKQPKRRGGFTETKVNDAQSYITLEEWIRRIAARGQLYRYMPLIEKLMDPTAELTANEIKEFVQVQKNFYYDIYYDERYHTEVPRQIKNAEFVLVPRFIKGTQLEKVNELMHEAGIDQLNTVETSKASNETVLTLWDNDGNLSGADTFVETINKTKCKQPYSYKYLYTQQETPQHMDAQNKAGIQIVKKILDNIPVDSPLYHHKEQFFALMVQNIKDSFTRLMEQFEVPTDSEGNIITNTRGEIEGLNVEVFYDKLRDEMTRLGVDSNLIDYVTLVDGEPRMPATFNTVLSRFESVVQSMFNQAITRQKLLGFHAAQVTNVGWSKLNEKVQDVSYAEDLEYHPDQYRHKKTGKIISKRAWNRLGQPAEYKNIGPAPYIEVMLPASAFGIDLKSKHYQGMSKKAIIAELEAKGLDIVMGYRIPTEGKQSICNMKCVGFIDDAYGSTIVVPNDWVSQTGSDFDIDSVYGIQFETYKDKTGEIHKVEYIENYSKKDEEKALRDYYYYIRRYGHKSLPEQVKGEIKDKVKAVRDTVDSIFDNFSELNKITDSFSEQTHNELKAADDEVKASAKYKNASENDKRVQLLDFRVKIANWLLTVIPESEIEAMNKYIELSNQILDFYQKADEDLDTTGLVVTAISGKLNEIHEAIAGTGLVTFDEFKALANSNTRSAEINSRAARNNKILDNMIAILSSPEALEENLSRSNFDDIIYWRNQIMSKNQTNERVNRGVYNILDQIAYQEDATSGLALKGMSVAMDTLCSVCNTAKARLNRGITVIYDASDFDEDPNKIAARFLDEDALKKAREKNPLAKGNTAVDGTRIIINHNMYGHSKDNRNVAGKLITAYSSQTTAHILDAIKEGAIPGVNEYTFTAYKTLVSIGSDYKTTISYIMQPAIQRIIANRNKNNSVFAKGFGNPIHNTIRDIAIELQVPDVKSSTPIDVVVRKLNEKYQKAFNEILDHDNAEKPYVISLSDNAQARIPLIPSKMVDRIKEKGNFKASTPVEEIMANKSYSESTKNGLITKAKRQREKQLLFDLSIVLSFDNIKDIADQVSSIATCLNPDKFGAKQTVFATHDTFSKMYSKVYNLEHVDLTAEQSPTGEETYTKRTSPILTAKRKYGNDYINILEAVYPGIEEGTRSNPQKGIVERDRSNESVYPTLYAYLKYASATSTVLAKKIFPTQTPVFVQAVRSFEKIMSGIKPSITEDLYNDIQKYLLSYMYNELPQISHPLIWDDKIKNIVEIAEGQYNEHTGDEEKDKEAAWLNSLANPENELKRVYGIGYSPTISVKVTSETTDEDGNPATVIDFAEFDVKDLNNPTKQEVMDYMSLTPAQKIAFIKANFKEQGLFGMLNVSLYNDYTRGNREGTQTIEFTEGNVSNETLYKDFSTLFTSTNPLIKLSMVDLIKYAVLVEGLRMTNKGIAKIISNDTLINDIGTFGIGFVKKLKDVLYNNSGSNGLLRDDKQLQEVFERYLRGHRDCTAIKTLYRTYRNVRQYSLIELSEGIIISKPNSPKVKETVTESGETINDASETPDEYSERINEWKSRLEKAGIYEHNRYVNKGESPYKLNSYVFIDTKGIKQLYKINYLKESIVLYPISNLEPNETGQFSVKRGNNKDIATQKSYRALITRYENSTEGSTLDSKKINEIAEELKKEGKWEKVKDLVTEADISKVPAKAFNWEKEAKTNVGLNQALNTVKQNLTVTSTEPIYILNLALRDYIYTKSNDPKYGSEQNITLADGHNALVLITKCPNEEFSPYLSMKKDKDGTWKFKYSDYDITHGIIKRGRTILAPITDPNLLQVVRDLRNGGVSNPNHAFKVRLYDNSTMHAGEEEANYVGYGYALSQASNENEVAADVIRDLKNQGIDRAKSKDKNAVTKMFKGMARIFEAKANSLYHDVNSFVKDPETGAWLKITDDKVQDLMKGNKNLEERYCKVANEITAALINGQTYVGLNISSDDYEANMYLNRIKDAYKAINELDLETINRKYGEGLLSQRSTNPLIKTNLLSAFDLFYGSSGLAWMFNDIGEASSPLVQIMLNEVMSDKEANRNMTKLRLREHHKKLKAFEDKARERGETIDQTKIFQDNYLAQKYSNAFRKDLQALIDAVNLAAEVNGYGSYEHLLARNKLDKFTAKYCNQEAKPIYYRDKAIADEKMLTRHKDIFVKYMGLYYELLDLRNQQSQAGTNSDVTNKMREVSKQIRRLHSKAYYDDDANWVVKSPEEQVEAKALNNYLKYVRELNEKYFEYESDYGFEEQVEIHWATVLSYEKRDPETGLPTVPQDVLEQHKDYVIAKNWLRNNAQFVIEYDEEGNADPNSISKRINAAIARLGLKQNTAIPASANMLYENEAFDENHVPDGRKLTDAQRAAVKYAMQNYYQGGLTSRGSRTTEPINSSRHLITCVQRENKVYKQEFWDNMNGRHHTEDGETYLSIVRKLNQLLQPLYDKGDGVIHFEWVKDDEEGIALLNRIAKGFMALRKHSKRSGERVFAESDDDRSSDNELVDETANQAEDNFDASIENGEEAIDRKQFIEDNIRFGYNMEAFIAQEQTLYNKSAKYKKAFLKCICDRDLRGRRRYEWSIDAEGKKHKGHVLPNSLIYSTMEVLNEERWLDEQRTEDINLLNTYYRKVPTAYYYKAMQDAIKRDTTEPGYYKKWYEENHIYNPYSNTLEPIDVWIKRERREEMFEGLAHEGKWIPRGTQRVKKVKKGVITFVNEEGNVETYVNSNEDMSNNNYKEKMGLLANYREGADNGRYDNPIKLNRTEQEYRDYLESIMINAAGSNSRAIRYFGTGELPKEALPSKTPKDLILSETGKIFGISTEINQEAKDWETNVGYENNFVRSIPMTSMLFSEKLGSKKFLEPKPRREDFDTKEEFETKYLEWKRNKKEVEENNKQVEETIRNKNWLEVIDKYLANAYDDLVVEQNKQKLYWLHNILRKQKVHVIEHNGLGDASLQKNERQSTPENTDYSMQVDTSLLNQYETFLRRFILDQWKEKSGKRTKIGNHLQNFTSANYMMLNFRGGIANVTLGETAMFAEAFAGEYFKIKHYAFGHVEWNKGMIGMIKGCYEEDVAYNLQDGITKLFKVVDYDEQRGVSTEVKISKYTERLRNAMFSPQTIGEHYMQNSVLFAMLKSHRLIDFPEDTRGIGKTFMNESEYIKYRETQDLYSTLPEDLQQKFDEFKNNIKSNEDEKALYAWYRKDLVTEFMVEHMNKQQRDTFFKTRKENREKYIKEFNEKEDMYSQMYYADGEFGFRPGSQLDAMNQLIDENAELTEEDKANLFFQQVNRTTKAYTLCGLFSNRVREVNTKIHGAYHRFGRAWIESKWYGSIIMQYHKHLPIGILKRYRTRGYYNEARASVEKGFLTSIRDFLSLNVRVAKNLRKDERDALEGVQNICRLALDYCTQLTTTWEYLPDYDKQTIKRNIGDLIGVLAGVMFVIGLKLWEDDDDELNDSVWWNLALYEADRLASEAFLYNPIGLLTETKTLMKTPVAAESVVEDIVSTVGLIGQFIMQGDDFSMTYKSGIHSGENKLLVFLERRIPMWHGIKGIIDIKDNNRAYKLGAKPTSFASTILSWIKE